MHVNHEAIAECFTSFWSGLLTSLQVPLSELDTNSAAKFPHLVKETMFLNCKLSYENMNFTAEQVFVTL